MKKIFILVILIFCAKGFAQNCDAVAKVDIIDKIKKYSPEDLLTYYDKDSHKWGYMTKEGKILTKPLCFSPHSLLFKPNAYFFSYKDCEINIYGRDYSFYTPYREKGGMAFQAMANMGLKIIDKGFELNTATNRVTAIAPKYNDLLYTLFIYQGEYYAVVKLRSTGKYGIIDREENILPNFDFKYRSLSFDGYYKDKNQVWFYFDDGKGNTGFKNIEGEVKFYNQLLSSLSLYSNSSYRQYCLQKKGKQSGVFDLENLEWIIPPQSKVKYIRITHAGLDIRNQTVYIVAEKGKDKYLIDLQGKEYKPKF